MKEVLHDGPHLTLTVDRPRGAAWISRTARSTREGGIAKDFMAMVAVAETLPLASMKLVVDVRHTVGRNDTDFETNILPNFLTLQTRFGGSCVLVATLFGQLQLQRLARERGLPFVVFTTDAEAERFLG